jgi:hypothetical protein
MFQRKHKFFIIKSSYSNVNCGENGKLTKSETRRKEPKVWPIFCRNRNSYFQPKLSETETESSVGHYANVEQTKAKGKKSTTKTITTQ